MGICIRLDDEYAITGDVRQYVLNKYKIKVCEKTGEPVEVFTQLGYFQKIESLIPELIKRKISVMEVSTLKELVSEVSTLAKHYSAVLESNQ